jgi:hypothetical protein
MEYGVTGIIPVLAAFINVEIFSTSAVNPCLYGRTYCTWFHEFAAVSVPSYSP